MSAEAERWREANPEPWTWPPDDGGGRWWYDANGEKVGYDALAAALEARDEGLRKIEDLAAHAAMQGNEEAPLDLLMEAGRIARDLLAGRAAGGEG